MSPRKGRQPGEGDHSKRRANQLEAPGKPDERPPPPILEPAGPRIDFRHPSDRDQSQAHRQGNVPQPSARACLGSQTGRAHAVFAFTEIDPPRALFWVG